MTNTERLDLDYPPEGSEALPVSSTEPAGRSGPPQGESMRGVLTNQRNLREFMSRRLIVPREAFTKYYDDLLLLTPGRIPIVSSPVSVELVEAVTSSADNIYPVFIELEELGPDPSLEILGWSSVKAVHFLSREHRREFEGHLFENVPSEHFFEVSPECFEGGSGTTTDYQESPQRGTDSKVERLQRAAQWSAAILRALQLAQTHIGSEAVVEALAAFFDDRPWPEDYKHLEPIRALRTGSEIRGGRSSEQKLFSVIAKSFIEQGRPADPSSFIQELLNRTDLDQDHVEQLRRVDQLLSLEETFNGWNFSDKGTSVIRGLYMVLVRSTGTDKLGDWALDEAGARDQDILTAAVLFGLCQARHTLSLDVRPPELDQYLAGVEQSAWLNESDELTPVSISGPQIIDGSKIRELRIGTVIVGVPEPPASLVDLVTDADLTNEHIKTACIDLIKSEGWGDEVVDTQTPVKDDYKYQRKLSRITQKGIVENELVIDKKKFVALLGRTEPVSAPATKLRQILVELQVPPASGG